MSKFSNNLHKELRPLYYLSKVIGLAPFSFTRNQETGEYFIDTNLSTNVGGVIWTGMVFCVMVGGFVYTKVRYQLYSIIHPGEAVNNAFSFPMNFIIAMVALINILLKGVKIPKLVKKLAAFDEKLSKYRNDNCFIYADVIVVLVVFVLVSYDTLISEKGLAVLHDVIYRLAYLIGLVTVMQFCKLVQLIQSRLTAIKKALSYMLKLASLQNVKELGTGKDVESCNLGKTTDDTTIIQILHLRQAYNSIYESTKLLTSIYGFPILLLLIRTSIALVTNVHGLIWSPVKTPANKEYFASLPVWIATFLGMIVVVTVSCQMATLECKEVADRVQKLMLQESVTDKSLKQLKFFSMQLACNKIEFSAFWFFTIDLSLLCTILASATTYIVILVQFKI